MDTDKESSQSLWENISDNLAMHLQEWGWVRNNTLVDPHDWSQKNQVFILTDKNMGHVNTGDGTFLYDSSISGGRVHMTNQRKLTSDDNYVSTNSEYYGWLEIIGLNYDLESSEIEILTVDNLGVYRIFKFFDLSLLN